MQVWDKTSKLLHYPSMHILVYKTYGIIFLFIFYFLKTSKNGEDK